MGGRREEGRIRGVAAIAVVLSVCGVLASRAVFARVADEEIFKRSVLVYGSGHAAAAIARLRRSTDRHGFALAGFVQPPGEDRVVPSERVLESAGDLCTLCERLGITEVVVAMDDRRCGFPIPELLDCRLAGIDVIELLTFLERETGRVRIDVLNPSWMIFSQGFRRDPLRLFSSRALDLLASLGVLVVALPAMVLTFFAIKLEDGWHAPALYRQARVGLGGKVFKVLKFRSMRQDAELNGAQWAQHADPRITRVGAIIRKLRIDELPQVINVLRGHMSFVGPRPERPEFVAELAEKIRTEAEYFEKNTERMRYPEFRRQHLFVGTGVIEAGCKTLIGSRCKGGCTDFYSHLVRRVSALPGVASVAAAEAVPGAGVFPTPLSVEGRPESLNGSHPIQSWLFVVTPG